MSYRRVYIEGGSYLFTVITEKRRKIFADDDNVKRRRAGDLLKRYTPRHIPNHFSLKIQTVKITGNMATSWMEALFAR